MNYIEWLREKLGGYVTTFEFEDFMRVYNTNEMFADLFDNLCLPLLEMLNGNVVISIGVESDSRNIEIGVNGTWIRIGPLYSVVISLPAHYSIRFDIDPDFSKSGEAGKICSFINEIVFSERYRELGVYSSSALLCEYNLFSEVLRREKYIIPLNLWFIDIGTPDVLTLYYNSGVADFNERCRIRAHYSGRGGGWLFDIYEKGREPQKNVSDRRVVSGYVERNLEGTIVENWRDCIGRALKRKQKV